MGQRRVLCPTHWKDLGKLPPQGGLQTDGEDTTKGTVWDVGVPHTGGDDGGDGTTGGGDLHLPPQEHSRTLNFNQAHCGPVSGGVGTHGDKG